MTFDLSKLHSIQGLLLHQLGTPLTPLETPTAVSALNGQSLATITHQTEPIQLILSGNHLESIKFICVSIALHSQNSRIPLDLEAQPTH